MSCNTDNRNPDLEEQDLEPTAGLSSAAACISIELLAVESGSESGSGAAFFKPVYTHQCFQHEVIAGFEPFHAEAQEAKDLATREYYTVLLELLLFTIVY